MAEDRPLTGRELYEQHKALVEAGASWKFTLDWLRRETDRWFADRPVASTPPTPEENP